MVFVSGCICGGLGGGGPEDDDTSDGGSGETGDETTATTKASGGGNLLGGVSLDSLMNLAKPTGYTITYEVVASSDGESSTMQYTQYTSGTKMRMDVTGKLSGEEMETRIYSLPPNSYMCMNAEGQWTCFGGEDESGQETSGGFDLDSAIEDIGDSADDIKPTYEGTRVIVGVTAQCFKVEMDDMASRYCAHPNYNIPLLAESVGKNPGEEGYFKMEAKSLSMGTPSDSVFKLPAEPTDLSALMGAMGGGDMPEDMGEE
jgi:hypothetical protein